MYQRPIFQTILKRLREKRKFMQVLAGPRQTGKTTLALQLIEEIGFPSHYASADDPVLQDSIWIEQQWEIARIHLKNSQDSEFVLILDEIQKIPNWSETIKNLWDEDTKNKIQLKVVVLGSAPLLIQRGLTESLAGRFEIIPITHWSYPEMRKAFGFSLEEFIYFGGYPGAADLIKDQNRWNQYINDSLIETTISKDILLMARIDKPALLRRLFYLGCEYSGQILSYTKMLGQLHDAGNTTTLSNYLDLLSGSGMLTEIKKFAGEQVRKRSSSPKLQVLNTGLMSAVSSYDFQSAQLDRDYWGRLVESAVGAHLVNSSSNNVQIFYWRDRGKEVDFIIQSNREIIAVEVKSGKKETHLRGMKSFAQLFQPKKAILVGSQGIAIEEFLSHPTNYW